MPVLDRPIVADAKMKGPTRTSNWVIAGSLLMGDDPVGGQGRAEAVLQAGVTLFIDLRSAVNATNYLAKQGVPESTARYLSFPFQCEDYEARKVQLQFVYSLLDALHGGEVVYLHDYTGHGVCGVVSACVLAAVHGWSGMKAANVIAQLHEVRDNTEGSACPVDSRSKDLKGYVKEAVRDLAYSPGSAPPLLSGDGPSPAAAAASATQPQAAAAVGGSSADSPGRFGGAQHQGFGGGTQSINVFGEGASPSVSSSRFAHSRNQHGGGASSINLFGGGGGDRPASVPQSTRRQQAPQQFQQQQQVPQQVPQQQYVPQQQQQQQQQQQPPSPAVSVATSTVRGARSCGGGVSQVNLFGGGYCEEEAKAVTSKVGGPPATPPRAHAAPHQQHHPVDAVPAPVAAAAPPAPAPVAAPLAAAPAATPPPSAGGPPPGTLNVQLRRGSTSVPWGFSLDGYEVVSVGPGSVAEQCGMQLGLLIGINNRPLQSDDDLEPLGTDTEVLLHVQPGAQELQAPSPSAGGVQTYRLCREPGQSWGIDVDDLWVIGVIPGSIADVVGVECGRLLFVNETQLHTMADCAALADVTECVIGVLPNRVAAAAASAGAPPSPARAMDLDGEEDSVQGLAAQAAQQQQGFAPSPAAAAPQVAAPALAAAFNTRDKAELATASGPTRTSNWVVPQRLLCGACPDLRKQADIVAIAGAGVTTVVNLLGKEDRQPQYFPALEQAAGRYGVVCVFC